MSLSTNQSILRGRFTSDGLSEEIVLPWFPSRFKVHNITQFGSTAAETPVMIAERTGLMPENSALTQNKTSGAATLQLPVMNLTDGISFIDGSIQSPGPELTGTAVTNADPAVVTIANHGLKVNDEIRLYETTGMLQIAGLQFTVTAVNSVNEFEIGLDASAFADPATAVKVRKIPRTIYFPEVFEIQNITQATEAVFTINRRILPDFSGFTVGQIVTFRVTEDFGMVEMEGLQGEILAIDGANAEYRVNINTSSFTAFTFPTSATAAAGVTFPQAVPIGKKGAPQPFSTANTPDDVLSNQARFTVELGTNALGGSDDEMEWFAERALLLS